MVVQRTIFAAVCAGLFFFPPAMLRADDVESGIKTPTSLELQITSVPEVKALISQSLIFPFLQGSNPLIKDNNIATVFTVDLTPISTSGIIEVIWTPAAFFLLSGGGRMGSGWPLAMGNGIGIKEPEDKNAPVPGPDDPPRKAKISGGAFDGFMWSAWGAGTLQFDLGAVIPGDWTHILFQTRQEFRYSAHNRAGPDDFWLFEDDSGENKNGWKYRAGYVLGYLMPQSPLLNTIAFMAEMEKNLYNSPGGDFWGEGLGRWIFSNALLFAINPRLSATLVFQLRTLRNFEIADYNVRDYYHQDFRFDSEATQRYVVFHRVVVLLNYKIR